MTGLARGSSVSIGGSPSVLHVINSVSPTCGGPTTAIWNVLDALHLAGVETHLVTTDDDGPGRRRDVPLGVTRLERDHRVSYFRRQTGFYAFSAPLAAWLARNIRRYDIVHAHGLFTFAPLAAASLARARGVPYVLRPTGVLNRWGRTFRRPLLKRVSIRLLEGRLLERAARVMFTSDAELEEASDLGIDMRPLIQPLALAEPPQWPTGTATKPLPGQGTADAAQTVLFLARIAPIKNLDLLLQALARTIPARPRLRLVVAGDGPADLVESLRAMASELGVQSRIDWLGFVQGDAKEAALRSATLLVLPSTSENFGLAAVEALARGIPVVLTRGVGVARSVGESGAGLVCDATVDDLSRCLTELLDAPDERARMGAAARRLFEDKYSLLALGTNLRAAYEALLAEHRSAGASP